MKLKVGSLFAGIGGIDLAFIQNDYKISWANEIDEKACVTYRENFNHKLFECGIDELDVPLMEEVDIITAGFPCQPFSVAGYRKGLEDDRGKLFYSLLSVIKQKLPSCVFLENVKNLVTHDKGKTFTLILKDLENIGYSLKYYILNTKDYTNLPQNRERVYIVGFLDNKKTAMFFAPTIERKKLTIQDILQQEVPVKYYYNESFKHYKQLKENIQNRNTFYQWRRLYVRENKNGVCPTLTANMGTGGHNVPIILNGGIRKLTPRECANLQGFPHHYILPKSIAETNLYKQIGNSVSVSLINKFAKEIKKVLSP